MIILRQKSFGRIGKWAYDLVNKTKEEGKDLYKDYYNLSNAPKSKEEKRLSRKLIKYAKDNGVDVMNISKGNNYAVNSKSNNPQDLDSIIAGRSRAIQERSTSPFISNYKKSKLYKSDVDSLKTNMRIRRALGSGKGFINVHGGKSKVGTIGHEAFHILGKRNFDIDNAKYDKAEKISNESLPTSRLDALKKSIQIGVNSIPRLREEAKASRGSIKWLKQNGASKSLLKSEKSRLKKAFGTYVLGTKYRILKPIAHYKDNNILDDTKNKLVQPTNPTFTVSQGNTINTVYGKGGKF